jgi:hypothetical protein
MKRPGHALFFVHEVSFDPINRSNYNGYVRKVLGEEGLQFESPLHSYRINYCDCILYILNVLSLVAKIQFFIRSIELWSKPLRVCKCINEGQYTYVLRNANKLPNAPYTYITRCPTPFFQISGLRIEIFKSMPRLITLFLHRSKCCFTFSTSPLCAANVVTIVGFSVGL